jgi:hypothetical protein
MYGYVPHRDLRQYQFYIWYVADIYLVLGYLRELRVVKMEFNNM